MDGFVVLQALEEDGELFVLVETTADIVGCPSCGVRATGHGRSTVQVRNLPNGGRAVRFVWRKRRWLCRDPDCDKKSFTESSAIIERSLNLRAEREICRLVGQEGNSVALATRSFGVGWETAMGCVRRHGTPLVEDPERIEGVRALGVDEHKMLSANRNRHTL